MKINKSPLYIKALSDQNIYNAIYSLESYVFEKGLLSDDDLDMYYRLSDKYDSQYISKIIKRCQKRLNRILTIKEELFDVKVYFKLKKYDDEKKRIKFRPIHTASLIDQICMVSLLNLLMFEDANKRRLSDLAKLIPHNFFGNIPSLSVENIFERWQDKYKEYTDTVIDHCRQYQKNHKFRTEVTLDIKNFFPSISPQYIYEFIKQKLSSKYKDEEDLSVFYTLITKLLYFKIDKKNLQGWLNEYYSNPDSTIEGSDFFMTCGIPQGLPQSYFFGNLCMIGIKKILDSPDLFEGDAYYYVDDSVIFINTELTSKGKNKFNDKIARLNNALTHFQENLDYKSEVLDPRYAAFQKKLDYCIRFHEEGKSEFRPIDEADNNLGGYENIARQTSMAGAIFSNFDEIDDYVSLQKLNAIDKVITNEIKKLEEESSRSKSKKGNFASRLKLLKRFKRFFLYRNRILKIREAGGVDESFITSFNKRFKINNGNVIDLQKWFEYFEEDIFQSESHIIINMQNLVDAERFSQELISFEHKLVQTGSGSEKDYLYYSKDFSASVYMKSLNRDPYKSLNLWVRQNYKDSISLGQKQQLDKVKQFIDEKSWNEILPSMGIKYADFIMKNSADFQRHIINAYYSETIGVETSNSLSFVKRNSRAMCYTELRILSFLRNNEFNLTDFRSFVNRLDAHDISNRMRIDMGLMEVLGSFIRKVRKPQWVDDLIITHRIVKGLWYNGSKFLNSYTLHNEEHAVTLIGKSIHIVKTIDYFVLKQVDYYILFLACYLHDISMVIHPDLYTFNLSNKKSLAIITDFFQKMIDNPDFKKGSPVTQELKLKNTANLLIDMFQKIFDYFENNVRESHPEDSAKYIKSAAPTLFKHISPTTLSYVANVSESHGFDTLEVYGQKSRAKDDLISKKYLMILIRLADLLDVANDRVNYHLLRTNVKHMNLISRFHWISHLITDSIQLTASYDVNKVALVEKPITENLNFNLYLNVKYLSTLHNTGKCTHWKCINPYDTNVVTPDEEYRESGGITLKITETGCSTKDRCPFICKWMTEKHRWLLSELNALNNYLFSVNTSLIKTNIRLNIFFRDEYSLDSDLFDDVKDYLEQR